MDYTLHEWVRMASHHGSIARCAIEKQAEESGLDALAVREKMRHHLHVMQEAAHQGGNQQHADDFHRHGNHHRNQQHQGQS